LIGHPSLHRTLVPTLLPPSTEVLLCHGRKLHHDAWRDSPVAQALFQFTSETDEQGALITAATDYTWHPFHSWLLALQWRALLLNQNLQHITTAAKQLSAKPISRRTVARRSCHHTSHSQRKRSGHSRTRRSRTNEFAAQSTYQVHRLFQCRSMPVWPDVGHHAWH